ncbi:MAG: 30S ribosomal protein S16, partial [Elusimicrobia bacterium GWA2_38_7]
MTKQPAYRLVAVDRRTARDGAELEILGTYNPKDKENRLIIKEERIKY